MNIRLNIFTITQLLLFAFFGKVKGQVNLVPNPSFEEYINCPDNQGQANLATGWQEWGSADYFNICSIIPNFSVPTNWAGFQKPASGKAYCGVGVFQSKKYAENYIEFIQTELTSSLSIGTKYFLSFKVSASISQLIACNCAIKELGALLTKSNFNFSNPISVNYTPQVKSANFITDTLNWTRVFGNFVADSNYKFITLGGFKTYMNTDTLILDGGTQCNSYYYFDDICLSTDSLFVKNYVYTSLNENEFENLFILFPAYTSDFVILKNQGTYFTNYKLFNVFGEILLNSNISALEEKKINLEMYSNGIYFLELNYKNYKTSKKIIKQ